MALNRTNFNLLVDGDEFTGTIWDKAHIKDVILDPVDAELTVILAAMAAADAADAAAWAAADALKLSLTGGTLTGDLKFTDATYDIGKAGATRPRDGFFSRNLSVGSGTGVWVTNSASGDTYLNGYNSTQKMLRHFSGGNRIFSGGASGFGVVNAAETLELVHVADDGHVTISNDGAPALKLVTSAARGTGTHYITFADPTGEKGYLGYVSSNDSFYIYQVMNADLMIYTNNAMRWKVLAAGHFVPGSSGMEIGASGNSVSTVWAGLFRGTDAIPMTVANISADTGTTLIVNGSGWMQKLTSSARYKEHLAALTIAPDMLDRFVERSPRAWDYTGQQTGAVGFIAEDLHDIAPNDYGRSSLLNYDADGRPESNRDFAIIGLQHLVIQDLWRRVAALEGKAHG